MLSTTLDVIGKIWNLPNTVIGLVVGFSGHIFGEVGNWLGYWNREPEIDWWGNNAVQFLNNPFAQTAQAFGNVIVYRGGLHGPLEVTSGSPYTLGYEESMHVRQGQFLGPLYFPAHILLGTTAMIVNWDFSNWGWHLSPSFLEHCPHVSSPSAFRC